MGKGSFWGGDTRSTLSSFFVFPDAHGPDFRQRLKFRFFGFERSPSLLQRVALRTLYSISSSNPRWAIPYVFSRVRFDSHSVRLVILITFSLCCIINKRLLVIVQCVYPETRKRLQITLPGSTAPQQDLSSCFSNLFFCYFLLGLLLFGDKLLRNSGQLFKSKSTSFVVLQHYLPAATSITAGCCWCCCWDAACCCCACCCCCWLVLRRLVLWGRPLGWLCWLGRLPLRPR